MAKSPAFQWYPRDILASARVQEMSLAEEGAYRRLLDYCWLNGSVPTDPKRCARLIGKGCTEETAEYVLQMFSPDPDDPSRMINERQEVERDKQRETRKKRKKAAEARWKSSGKPKRESDPGGQKANGKQMQTKSNAHALHVDMHMQCPSSSSSTAVKNSQQERPVERGRSPAKRGTRLPPDFQPRTEDLDWAKKSHPSIDPDYETGKFRDYWTAKPGKDGVKLDWTATWRNWIRKADEYGSKSGTNGRKLTHAEQYARYGYED